MKRLTLALTAAAIAVLTTGTAAWGWSTTQSAHAYCDTEGGTIVQDVLFTNTDTRAIDVTVWSQTLTAQPGQTVRWGDEFEATSSPAQTVRFDLAWVDGYGTDVRYADMNAVPECKQMEQPWVSPSPSVTPTPTPTPSPTPTPTATPTPSVTSTPSPSTTPAPTPSASVPPPPELPRTGISPFLVVAGLALLGAGIVLVVSMREW